MTSMQKRKGNDWEKQCASFLTKTFGEHFHRNISGSGGFLGGKNATRKQFVSQSMINTNKGDIICPDSFNGHLVIECKSYKEFPFNLLLTKKEIAYLKDWIEQQYDTIDENDFWFICFKINHLGEYIVIPMDLCDFIDDKIGNFAIYTHSDGKKFFVSDFENFITSYKDEIKKKCN